jgi:hypothetical protein
LAVTVFVAAVYIGQMTKLSAQMWGYQQKWIMLLLLLLVLFDGPLAYPRIYTVSWRHRTTIFCRSLLLLFRFSLSFQAASLHLPFFF